MSEEHPVPDEPVLSARRSDPLPASTWGRPWIAALISTAAFGAVLAFWIARRGALSVDELHTALLGRLWADGEPLSFYVGSLTRYEGGSWLIAWPVSWLMRLGAWGTAATSWTAGAIALVTVFATSLWLARAERPLAGLAVGPLAALAAPELVHYAYRAWGSLCEALVFLPLLALAFSAWQDRGRRLSVAPAVGLLLGLAVVFSYLHMLTALALLAVLAEEARRTARWKRAATEAALIGASASLVFGAWVALMVPIPAEALEIRGGRSLLSACSDLLFVRLDRVLLHLPRAWIGELLPHTALRLAAGVGLTLMTVAAAVVAWRRGGRTRQVVLFALVCVPGMSLGHALAGPPQVYRYYLPLLGAAVVLIAAWDMRAVVLAAALGLALQLPSGPPEPWQAPDRSHLELGASALHRFAPDPHVKFEAFYRVTTPRLRPYLAFGYGLDTGARFGPSWAGMRRDAGGADAVVDTERDPHLHLFEERSWIGFWDGLTDRTGERRFFEGVGVGLLRDGVIDAAEVALLAAARPRERAWMAEGIGAALLAELETGRSLTGWSEAWRGSASDDDWEAVGRGLARCAGLDGLPPGVELSLEAASPALSRLRIGLEARRDVELRAMVLQPVVPTPER